MFVPRSVADMSLFEWSTPERRTEDRILRIIPNEIYFHIFEHIAPLTGRLTPKQLQSLARLSCVCRFFANHCLPRIFESVEFSGSIFRDDTPTGLPNDASYKTSRESTLCAQIIAKQPLALALAKTVRVCHFTNWKLDEVGAWAVKILFTNKYIAAMSHMQNIRKLKFSNSFIETEHWNAVAVLPSLEELTFVSCRSPSSPAEVEPVKRVKVKVSRLQVVLCRTGFYRFLAAIDTQYLRALVIDISFFDQVDWHLLSALTELCLSNCYDPYRLMPIKYMEVLRTIPMQLPRSLEALRLSVEGEIGAWDAVRSMLGDPAWINFTFLRSLTLSIGSLRRDAFADILSSVSEGIGRLANLQSFALDDSLTAPQLPTSEIQQVVHDKLGPVSNIKYVRISGRIQLHLVDGEWLEVPSTRTG